MSGDPEQEYFADGMSKTSSPSVAVQISLRHSRNSLFTYKGKAVDIKQVGRELGVRYVLEGSVRRAGGRCITAPVDEAAQNKHLWRRSWMGI
jgi:adenylate cyclase